MIGILDHQDSFTYNIFSAIRSLSVKCQVESTVHPKALENLGSLSGLILSPGPGHPKDASLFYRALEMYTGKIPILGVCLGHQAIAHYYGASIEPAVSIIHGKSVTVEHSGSPLYAQMPSAFLAMRYNSLTVNATLSPHLELTAWSGEEVMGLRHKEFDVEGVQFHPESVGTPEGLRILANFVHRVQKRQHA